MATSEKSGKPKKVGRPKGSSKSKNSSKKGGNFLGSIGELVAPTGWESFATTAGLFAIDRADAALRRKKSEKSNVKKMSGGGETDINKEALHILQTNRYLTNAFLRLYNYAYTLDTESSRNLRVKLNNFIDKEVKKRIEIFGHLEKEALKNLIKNSIINLLELKNYANLDFVVFQEYFKYMLEIQPNINNSSIDKTLSNINNRYKN